MPDAPAPWSGQCQILSLDGGGIRGLFSAAVLASFERDLNVNVVDHFDLITGTSTGGIIALALGMGVTPLEVVEFYVEHGPSIFPDGMFRGARRLFKNKYDQEPLKRALREVIGEKTLGESTKRLVIPAYNLGQDQVRLFKTPHHPRLVRDWKIPAWQVALATSAAPTYFPACSDIDRSRMIDGGVWANNPTVVAIAEAKSMLNVPLESIRVFSLGTCDDLCHPPDELDKGGLLKWKYDAVRVALRGQSQGATNTAIHLLGQERVHRLDPPVPKGLYELDKVTANKLIAQAAHDSLHFSPTFKDQFCNHLAREFKPYHMNGGKDAAT